MNSTLAALVALAFAAAAFGEQYRIQVQGVTTALSAGSGSWGDDVAIGTPLEIAFTIDPVSAFPFNSTATNYQGTDGLLTVGSFRMQMRTNYFVFNDSPSFGDGYRTGSIFPATNNRFPY
ncbi:MAG TPA: hypothetical protein VGC27_09905, partial [Rhizomicrobium sp.]